VAHWEKAMEIEALSESYRHAAESLTRDFSRGLLAELCSRASDARQELREHWTAHERRWGPEIDEHVRSTVHRALGGE